MRFQSYRCRWHGDSSSAITLPMWTSSKIGIACAWEIWTAIWNFIRLGSFMRDLFWSRIENTSPSSSSPILPQKVSFHFFETDLIFLNYRSDSGLRSQSEKAVRRSLEMPSRLGGSRVKPDEDWNNLNSTTLHWTKIIKAKNCWWSNFALALTTKVIVVWQLSLCGYLRCKYHCKVQNWSEWRAFSEWQK